MRFQFASPVIAGMLCLACLAINAPVLAQQANAPAKAEAKRAPATPRGRLPAYFSKVVPQQQRAQIYALQKPIMEKIDALEAQIAELKAQLEKESRALLTPEQIKTIDELSAAAKEKPKAAREADSAKSPDGEQAAPAVKSAAAGATPKK